MWKELKVCVDLPSSDEAQCGFEDVEIQVLTERGSSTQWKSGYSMLRVQSAEKLVLRRDRVLFIRSTQSTALVCKSSRDQTVTKTLCLFSVSLHLLFLLPTFHFLTPFSLSRWKSSVIQPTTLYVCHSERLIYFFDAPKLFCWYAFIKQFLNQ